MAAPVTCADVLVIGGGPAGTSAAITSAKRGLSVVMIEARTFPRQRPGETLHPGVEPLLETLGVAEAVRNAGFPRHAGIWVKQGERLEFQQYGADRQGPWLGFQANRAQLDALLLAKVKAVGVTVLQPERALGLLYKGNNVSGATTTAGAIEASTTIDASGSTGWLARQLALPVRRTSQTRIAMYGYVEGSCPIREYAPLFSMLPDGWLWTARVAPRLFHWTRLTTSGGPIDARWVPEEYRGLKLVSPIKGADVTWRHLDACAGPGFYVAGDAATVQDPSSSHGVLRAIMSGILAGHMATSESQFASEYRQSMRFWFDKDSRSARAFKLLA